MTDVNEQPLSEAERDLEQLELYLDRELSAAEVATLESRLQGEPSLRSELERLRAQRSRRLAAMSFAFDNDSATIERLVASVRTAQVNEAIARRRQSTGWLRPALSAAACVAFGLGLGVVLHKQHSGVPADTNVGGSVRAIGGFGAGSSGPNIDANFKPQPRYVVNLIDGGGHLITQVTFPTQEAAQAYIEQLNNRADRGVPNLNVGGEMKMSTRPY